MVEKVYFTIKEAAEDLESKLGWKVPHSTLRHWERRCNLTIRRTMKNKRQYTAEDLHLFRIILNLKYKYKMSLESIDQILHSTEYRARLTSFLLIENFEYKSLRV